MSEILIPAITGTGTYAVPTSDASVLAAQSGFASLLSGIAGFSWTLLYAYVATADGVSPARTLECRIQGATLSGQAIFSAASAQTLMGDIETALLADPNISAIGTPSIAMAPFSETFLWKREGYLVRPLNANDIVRPQMLTMNTDVYSGAMPAYPSWQSMDLSAAPIPTLFAYLGFFKFTASAVSSQITARPLQDFVGLNYAPNYPTVLPYQQATPTLGNGQSAYFCCEVFQKGIRYVGTGQGTVTLLSIM